MREIRHIAEITRLIEAGVVNDPRFHRTYFHLVHANEEMKRYGMHTKYDTAWSFLTELRDIGRRESEAWLAANFDTLGKRSSLSLQEWAPKYWRRTQVTTASDTQENVASTGE
jgi:NTE family protein